MDFKALSQVFIGTGTMLGAGAGSLIGGLAELQEWMIAVMCCLPCILGAISKPHTKYTFNVFLQSHRK